MRSAQPKVLHKIAGQSMLSHVLSTATQLQPRGLHVVVGHGAKAVQAELGHAPIEWVLQEQQLGTGHAVREALPNIASDSVVLVLYGDVPLISTATLQACVAAASSGLALITAHMQDPAQLGRIVRNAQGDVQRIVEYKDASPAERKISETNSGILAAPAELLRDHLARLTTDNAQGEYYLTDVISSCVDDGVAVLGLPVERPLEVAGVNDRVQLAELEREYQRQQTERLMRLGATLMDPSRVDVRGQIDVGEDCLVDVNVVFEGQVTLGANVRIGPGCVIKDATIGAGTQVHAHTLIDNALVGERCSLGPFARIRPGSKFSDEVKVGNFVETKKAQMGRGSKASHLSYLGDAQIGAQVNIGAGTVTCNYDGVNKHKTTIGNGVFVGTNTTLVAPIELADDTFVAAGSTLTSKVEAGSLAVGRVRQRNIPGWKRPTKSD